MDSDPSLPRSVVDRTASRRWVDAAIFVIAIAVVAVPAWQALASHDMDPTTLLRVGKFSASREFIERNFADPVLTDDYGHDGQQFYVLAATFPDLADAQGNIDRLRYRARRILLPALVSPVPRGEPLIWSIFVVNLAAVGSAAVAVGHLARRLGTTAWLGLVVALTPAMIESVEGSLADAPAFSLALWGIVVWRRRPWLAVALFTLAALGRETTLVAPLACALVAPRGHRVKMLSPLAAFAAWVVTVSVWLPATPRGGSSNLVDDASVVFDWPFAAWAKDRYRQPGSVPRCDVGGGGARGRADAARSATGDQPVAARRSRLVDRVERAGDNRAQNFARVAPLALAGLALTLANRVSRQATHPIPDLARGPI